MNTKQRSSKVLPCRALALLFCCFVFSAVLSAQPKNAPLISLDEL